MTDVDLLVVGGGINGAGIARDAAGRGLSVLLVERDDLAAHTSSASTKLIHGGLRYLEYGAFRLVREALIEREVLLGIAPHIIWPLDFVLPQAGSPRPAWMVRLGLFLYDHLGGRRRLPATRRIDLARDPRGEGLASRRGAAFVYADCWVDDARLVVLNARDAAAHGATIATHTGLIDAARDGDRWRARIADADGERTVTARALVNAAGPWVADILSRIPGAHPDRPDPRSDRNVRLVKGSHIVLPRLYPGDHAFLLQNDDRRVVFAIPYEREFTLIGTTDRAWDGPPGPATIDAGEIAYLCDITRRYFARNVTSGDIHWTYSGIRPLYDDHAASASAVTRDYVLDLDRPAGGAPLLSVFGGKITTYRRLAEHALQRLAPDFPAAGPAWTAHAPLPGDALPDGDFDRFLNDLSAGRPNLPRPLLHRLARAYGTDAAVLLDGATTVADLGEDFGAGLHAREIDHLVHHEWARTAEDILYRRSKLGLHVPPDAAVRIANYLINNR